MTGSGFIFDCAHLLYYKCHKINLIYGGPHIDSPDWIKNKKASINPVNNDDKWFQYDATVALNLEQSQKNLKYIQKEFRELNLYSWKGINYPSRKDD